MIERSLTWYHLSINEHKGRDMATIDLHPQYVTDSDGHKTAVLLPFEEFQELLADLSDLAAIATRINEPTQSLSSLKSEFTANGLL